MRALAISAASLIALAGCSSSDPAPQPAADSPTTTASAEPVETAIALGEPFTIAGPNYTAQVTIERVYVPSMCDGISNQHPAIEADVEVISGDGTREVLNTGTIRERTPDGYIERERTVSRNCDGIDELDAMNAQTGDKFRGVRWLSDDVNPQSEILINAPAGQGAAISELFVLDLGEFDLAPAPATSSGAATSQPATTEQRSIWAPPGQGIQCPGTDAFVWDFSDCNPSNGVIDPAEFNRMVEQQNRQPAHDGVPIADGGTCPAAICGYGHDEQGNRNPTSGEIQTQHGCEQGYITDAELCAAVGSPIQ